MSILINKETTFIVQGITGREAVNLTRENLDYGAKIIGGVTPGRAGRDVYGVPVYDCVRDIVEKEGPIEGAIISVPPKFTCDAAFEALENGTFTDYPSAGFPARYAPRESPVRIVAMGGSSTGGAFQNDDLADFYPARLDALLRPGAEVVNQGAGSWNSFHVRAYGEHWLAQADADIVTVYLGVNESQRAPVTYRDLHGRWKDGSLQSTPGPLASLRLLHGLRYLSRGIRGAGELAVPPDHFEDNLRDLAARVTGSGGRVLLMPEAAYPSAEAFAPYHGRMRDIAGDLDGVEFLETSAALADGGAALFLDQNHLTDVGHRRLAEVMQAELSRLGWLEPR